MNDIKKILLLGDAGVGKTCFTDRFLGKKFERRYIPTLYQKKTLTNQFIFYEYPGQYKFNWTKNINNMENIDYCIILYDVKNKASYRNAWRWAAEFNEWNETPNVRVIIMGNKTDECVNNFRQVYDNNTLNVSVKLDTMESLSQLFTC